MGERVDRRAIKRRRVELLYELDRLETERCDRCVAPLQAAGHYDSRVVVCNCPAAERIRLIGEELNVLANMAKRAPETLNRQSYEKLKGWEWTDKDISNHYGIPLAQLKSWMQAHGLTRMQKEEEQNMVALHEDKLTVESYKACVLDGMTDKEIAKHFGLTYSYVINFKQKNDLRTGDIKKGSRGVADEKPVLKPADAIKIAKDRREEHIAEKSRLQTEVEELKAKNQKITRRNMELNEKNIYLEDEVKRLSDAESDLLGRVKRQEAAIQSLQAENERLEKNQSYGEKADELQAKMLDWKKKYEDEHIYRMEAEAVIEETKRNLLDGWEDDTEELNTTRHALAHAEANVGRLTSHARELEQRNKQLEKHLEDMQSTRENLNDRWAQSDEKFLVELDRQKKLLSALLDHAKSCL